MDYRLRELQRAFNTGEVPLEALLRGLARAGQSLEVVDVSNSSGGSVSVLIDLGYTDEDDVTTFGVWDFDEVLEELVEGMDPHDSMDGREFLPIIPEIIDVFNEVDIDLASYPSLYLEPDPLAGPFISFQVHSRAEASRIYDLLEKELGIDDSSLSLRQYGSHGYIIFDETDLDDSTGPVNEAQDSRVSLLTGLLEAAEEGPLIVPLTFMGIELQGLLPYILNRSEQNKTAQGEFAAFLQRELNRMRPDENARLVSALDSIELGVVLFENTNIISDTGSENFNISEPSMKKNNIDEAIEFVLVTHTNRVTTFLINMQGDLLDFREESPMMAEDNTKDFLESGNRWNREVYWLPSWSVDPGIL